MPPFCSNHDCAFGLGKCNAYVDRQDGRCVLRKTEQVNRDMPPADVTLLMDTVRHLHEQGRAEDVDQAMLNLTSLSNLYNIVHKVVIDQKELGGITHSKKRMRLANRTGNEMMRQGGWGLCTSYASATITSHAMIAKYGLWFEPQILLDIWLQTSPLPLAAWPKQLVRRFGEFRLFQAKAMYLCKLACQRLPGFAFPPGWQQF